MRANRREAGRVSSFAIFRIRILHALVLSSSAYLRPNTAAEKKMNTGMYDSRVPPSIG